MNTAENQILKGFSGINNSIFDSIMKVINGLDTTDARVSITNRNIVISSELDDIVRSAVANSGYRNNVDQYMTNFDKLSKENARFHSSVNSLAGVSGVITKVQKLASNQTIKSMTGAGMNSAFVNPVSDNLQQYILNGLTRNEMAENLRTFVKGAGGDLGLLERHVKQVSRDTIREYDGILNEKIQETYKLNAIAYQGSIMDNSRPQCIRWVNAGAIYISDLENEISWAYANGKGMIPGTTKNNFMSKCGGFNCRHTGTPIQL